MKNNKSILKYITIALMSVMVFSSCEKMMVGEMIPNTHEDNFQYMWKKFDTHYGLFLEKNINWDSVYATHLPLAKNANSEDELYAVLSSMLSNLNDQHVNIYPTNNKTLQPYNSGWNGVIPTQEDYLFSNVKDNYLMEYHEINEDFHFGMLPGNIGYIHISKFMASLSNFKKGMDKALSTLSAANGIIFDIRNHGGGDDRVSKYIAGRFATSTKLFMTSKKRNGPAHDDFENVISWYVEKEGSSQFTKPVILLTTRYSISAAETFTFAMRENSNVLHMGDTTAGAFSDVILLEMPNRWYFTVGVGDYRASNGKSYEGIGIAPQIYSKNLKADVLSGIDKTLELAIDKLN